MANASEFRICNRKRVGQNRPFADIFDGRSDSGRPDVETNSENDSSSEYDTDLDDNEFSLTQSEEGRQRQNEEKNEGVGHLTYTSTCRELGTVPSQRVAMELRRHIMRLQHIGLNTDQCRALACALLHNTRVRVLDLEDTGLTSDGLVVLLNALRSNANITSLSLCENVVDGVGALALVDVLRDTSCLTHLSLSGAQLGEREMDCIASGFQVNSTLVWLDLSHNNISLGGAKKLGRALGDMRTLQYLDVSWNHIRLEGAVGLLKGIKISTCLEHVNLAMNGLGFEGSLQLEPTLLENSCLRYLDVSHNRINWEGVSFVAKGLRKNATLRVLKIGHNPINMEGCYELLKAVAVRRSRVIHIGLENIPVNGAVLTVVKEVTTTRQFAITHGGVLDTRDVVGIRKEKPEDPITLVVRYLSNVGIRIIDLFRMFDSDNAGEVSRREFIRGLKRVGVPLSDRDLYSVAHRLDKHRKGYISYSLLSNGVRNHIREERKEETRKEVKKRNRLEERRRILQTELPEIYKRKYDDDLFMFYASSTTGTPTRSRTGSTASHTGSQLPILPPIQSATSSFASALQADTRVLDETEVVAPVNGSSGIETPASVHWKRTTSSKGGVNNSYKLMWHINKYLERKKTQANFDLVSTDSTV